MLHKLGFKFLPQVLALIFSGLLGLSVMPAFAADLQVDESGKLTGAKDINVNGNLYDVEFAAGTFQSVFGFSQGYNNVFGDFGIGASNALLEQVFIDGPLGNFDSDPRLTSGCESVSGYNSCLVITPYALGLRRGVFSVWGLSLNNNFEEINDNVVINSPIWIDYNDPISSGNITWARWSVASSVPEPSSNAMMILGLFSVFLITYRRQK